MGFDSDTGPGCGLAGSWLRCWVCCFEGEFLGDELGMGWGKGV